MKNESANELTIHELLRNQHVKRWHIVHTDRCQTVAEHLWAVTVLGWELYKRMDLMFPWDSWTKLLMLHDSTESITGDLPTPAKKLLKDDGWALGYEYSKEYASIDLWGRNSDNGLPSACLKLVDLIEAIRHMDIHGRGAHAKSVRGLLASAFQSRVAACGKTWPLLQWTHAVSLFNDSITGPDNHFDGTPIRVSELAL